MSGTWATNSQRQLTASMIGPPMATPSTGPPAPTSDHQPITFERDSGGNTLKRSDQEAAVVHAPSTPDSSRAAMSRPAFGARIVSTEHSSAPDMPMR